MTRITPPCSEVRVCELMIAHQQWTERAGYGEQLVRYVTARVTGGNGYSSLTI